MAKEKIAPLKVCAYCRVSTTSASQKTSDKNQILFFQEMFKQPKYEKIEIYTDPGISGTKLNRSDFDRMLIAAGLKIDPPTYQVVTSNGSIRTIRQYGVKVSGEEPKFEEIFVRNTSRFARNIDVVQVLKVLLFDVQPPVYVTFLDVGLSTRKETDLPQIISYLNTDAAYSAELSRKVRFGNSMSIIQGKLRSHPKIYGYKYIKLDEGFARLEIIPNEAELVKFIFEEYADGNGFRIVQQKLDRINAKTRKGKSFSLTTLKHIIDNEKYMGFVNTGKFDTGPIENKYGFRKVNEQYSIKEHNDVPAIISPDLFEKCSVLRKEKSDIFSKRGLYSGKSTAFKGLIFCGNCGSKYIHNIDIDSGGYYNCKRKKNEGRSKCNNANAYDTSLNEFIEEQRKGGINEQIDEDQYRLLDSVLYNIENDFSYLSRNDYSDEICKLRNIIDDNTSTITELYKRAALPTTLSPERTVIPNITKIEQETHDFNKRLTKLLRNPTIIKAKIEADLELCNDIVDMISNRKSEYSREELLSFIDKIIIHGSTHKISNLKTPISIKIIMKTSALAGHLLEYKNDYAFNLKTFQINFGVIGIKPLDDYKSVIADFSEKVKTLTI